MTWDEALHDHRWRVARWYSRNSSLGRAAARQFTRWLDPIRAHVHHKQCDFFIVAAVERKSSRRLLKNLKLQSLESGAPAAQPARWASILMSDVEANSMSHFGSRKMVRTAGLEPAFPFEKQIFLPPRLSPPPHRRSWSGLSLRQGLSTVGATRLVSTPSPEGLARDWLRSNP